MVVEEDASRLRGEVRVADCVGEGRISLYAFDNYGIVPCVSRLVLSL